jgi:hypothetical protein
VKKFNQVIDLAKLPYFKANESGTGLIYKGKDKNFIDFHTHVGGSYLLGRPIDWLAEGKTQTFFPISGKPIDLSHYSAFDFDKKMIAECRKETLRPIYSNTGINATHTFPNLIREMTALGFEKTVVLAIDIRTSGNSRRLLKTAPNFKKQVIPFVSVHPKSIQAAARLKRHAENGARGLKIHPTVQMVRPADRKTISLVRLAGELGLPVIFHCGNSPLSPKPQELFNRMEDFEKCIREAPETTIILGHSGMNEYKIAIKIAEKYPRVYLELSGQPPAAIKDMIKHLGDDRLLFGSDWPYYPIALPMAKVLLATEDKPKSRQKIMQGNARKLLKLK